MHQQYSSLIKLLLIFVGGALMWFNPVSNEITPQAWHLFVIFLGTMVGIVLSPLPISAMAMLGAGMCLAMGVLTTQQVLDGFSEKVVWLLVFAFLIARGIIKTGLGKRMAYYFISKIGKTTLGLSYGLVFTELFLAPLIPSVTARGGGVVYPIAMSLVDALSTEHHDDNKSHIKRTMAYLSQVCFQTNLVTSAMFLTGMAANPLIQSFSNKAGAEVTWSSWALGGIVPGLISLFAMPLIIYLLHPPAIKTSPQAPQHALEALKKMGRVTIHELIMIVTFASLIVGWILDKKIGVDATSVAMIGVVVLLVTGVLDWTDALNEKGAWDSFIWFAIMIMLSGYLAEYGVIKWIATHIAESLKHYPAIIAVPALMLLYFYLHYFFASVAAQVTVLFSTFLILIMSFDVPVMIAAMTLAYFSSLSGGLTHYGIATAPIYFGTKSVTTKEWWKIGFIVSVINIAIWGVVGGVWWKYLGWF